MLDGDRSRFPLPENVACRVFAEVLQRRLVRDVEEVEAVRARERDAAAPAQAPFVSRSSSKRCSSLFCENARLSAGKTASTRASREISA